MLTHLRQQRSAIAFVTGRVISGIAIVLAADALSGVSGTRATDALWMLLFLNVSFSLVWLGPVALYPNDLAKGTGHDGGLISMSKLLAVPLAVMASALVMGAWTIGGGAPSGIAIRSVVAFLALTIRSDEDYWAALGRARRDPLALTLAGGSVRNVILASSAVVLVSYDQAPLLAGLMASAVASYAVAEVLRRRVAVEGSPCASRRRTDARKTAVAQILSTGSTVVLLAFGAVALKASDAQQLNYAFTVAATPAAIAAAMNQFLEGSVLERVTGEPRCSLKRRLLAFRPFVFAAATISILSLGVLGAFSWVGLSVPQLAPYLILAGGFAVAALTGPVAILASGRRTARANIWLNLVISGMSIVVIAIAPASVSAFAIVISARMVLASSAQFYISVIR